MLESQAEEEQAFLRPLDHHYDVSQLGSLYQGY